MMKPLVIIFLLLWCLSNHVIAQTSKYIHLLDDTSIHLKINEWVSSIYENTNPPKSYTYNFDYTLPYVENLRNGFMDTFAVANTKFRYRLNPDTSRNCIVEKFKNGEWIINFETNYSSYQDSFLCDVNNDGYKDFIEKDKWYSYAILFNPSTKEFDVSTGFGLNQWAILNKKEKIFCNSVEVHGGQEQSKLYVFNGVHQQVLYSLKFIYKQNYSTFLRQIKLYKGDIEDKDCKCTLINTIKINSNEYEFDYLSYWKRNYRKLFGYR